MEKETETPKSIFRNVLYGFSTWILPLGLSFAATPLIVRALGHEEYGIYALVLGFIGYSFNFNTGRAITKYIAEYRAAGRNSEISEVVSATLILNVILGLTGTVSIILLTKILVTDVFQITPAARIRTEYAFYVSALIIFATMINQVFNSILQGLQRFDLFSKFFNLNSFAILLGNIVLAVNGFGLLALLLWNLFVLLVVGCILGAVSFRLLPDFRFNLKNNTATIRLILRYSAGLIGYQIVSNLLLLFERGWIIRNLGEESLTFYVVPMLLGIYIHGFISSLLLVIFPLSSELGTKREQLLSLYLKTNKFVLILVFFLAVSLTVQSRTFLELWMGTEFAEKSSWLLVIHAVTFSLVAIQVANWQMTEGLGHTVYNFLLGTVNLLVSALTMIFLTETYGLYGIAAGRYSGFFIIFFSIFVTERWFFGKVQTGFWLKTLGRLIPAAAFAGFCERWLQDQFDPSWPVFLLTICAGGLGYGFVLIILGLINADDRNLFEKMLRR